MAVYKNTTNSKIVISANRGTSFSDIVMLPNELKIIPNKEISNYSSSINYLSELGNIINIYAPSDTIPEDGQVMIYDASINDWRYVTLNDLIDTSSISPKWDDIKNKPELFTKDDLNNELDRFLENLTYDWSKITDKPNLVTQGAFDATVNEIKNGVSNSNSLIINADTDNYTYNIDRTNDTSSVLVSVFKIDSDNGSLEMLNPSEWSLSYTSSVISVTVNNSGKYKVFYLG